MPYIDQPKPSIIIKLIYGVLRLINFKNIYVKRIVLNAPRSKYRPAVPWFLRWGVDIEKVPFEGRDNYLLKPKAQEAKHHIIYYHGGHYINECEWGMYIFIWKLVRQAKVSVCITDYPLAPEHNYLETQSWALQHYMNESEKNELPISLLGDSAGGGLALALAQNIKEQGLVRKHANLLLLCPWLDMVQNDLTEEDSQKCLLLQQPVMQYAALKFSNGDALDNFLLSPLCGPLVDLGEITVWYGTDEIMAKSIDKLHIKAESESVDVKIYRGIGHHHEYFLLPVPEQQQVLDQIKRTLF